MSDDDRNPVDLLADEFAARLRSGESPSMQEYLDRYPEHAAEIEELFPGVALLEQLSERQDSEASYTLRPQQSSLPAGHRFGDIEIIREIGRGGMGIVYEAYQHSLNRSVAIKAISGSAMQSPNQAARFQREAQAAARLHHTNIVPVFGVGEQEGTSYYVMQLIHGMGLDAILTELARSARTGPRRDRPSDTSVDSYSARDLAAVLVSGQLSESTLRGATGAPTPRRSLDPNATIEFRHVLADDQAQSVLEHHAENRTEDRTGEMSSGDTPQTFVRSSLELRDESPASFSVRSSVVLRDELRGSETVEAAEGPAAEVSGFDPSLASLGQRYWRNVARIGLQVASGLQYAHSQGTLHRDIKPANILLDTEGTAWIADFGLAKLLEQEDVTKTGDVVGTLRYMSPEQFGGESDGRSDLYSLGLTLYELLTLRPAYDDTDRQTLIARKLTPHEPTHPRKLHPGIPRDLETIVLKCLSFESAGRYQTAGALVADLQRYLEDQPIKARRISPAERFWRWCKRNPAVASLSTLVLALLLLIAILTSIGYVVAQRRADLMADLKDTADQSARDAKQSAVEADEERSKAEDARTKTEQIVELQWQALDAIYDTFVPDRFAGPVEASVEDDEAELEAESTATILSPQTATMLERMLTSFDQIAEIRGTDARFLAETAKANQKVGDLHLRLGQFEQAIEAFERAIVRYRDLEAMNGPASETSVMLARLYNGLSVAHGSLGHRGESRAALQQTVEILSQPTFDATDPTVRFERAVALYLMGRRSEFFGRRGGGRGSQSSRSNSGEEQRRSDDSERTSREDEPSRTSRSDAENRDPNRDGGRRSRRRSGPDSAENRAHLQAALFLLTPLTEEYPSAPDYQFLSALCEIELSHPWVVPQGESGHERLATAIQILERLVENHSSEPDFLYQLSEAFEQRFYRWKPGFGSLFWQLTTDADENIDLSTIGQAEADLREAVRLSSILVRQQPNVTRYAESHTSLLYNLADVRAVQGDLKESRKLLEDAAELRRSLKERFPETRDGRGYFSDLLYARILIASDDHVAAREVLEQMVVERSDPSRREFLRPVYEMLATVHEALGDSAAAAAALKEAELLQSGTSSRSPRGAEDRGSNN